MSPQEIDPKQEKIESEKRNNILKIIFIIFGIFVIGILTWMIVSSNNKNFDYRGVDFEIVDEVAPYRTNLAINQKNGVTGAMTQIPYSFYMRKDPRELDKIPFEGKLILLKNVVFNTTNDFHCEGNGILGMTNLARLLGAVGINTMRDETASCDIEGRFMFVNLEEGNETKIVQNGPSCYKIYINNCEVLEATERFMLETLVEIDNLKSNNNNNNNQTVNNSK